MGMGTDSMTMEMTPMGKGAQSRKGKKAVVKKNTLPPACAWRRNLAWKLKGKFKTEPPLVKEAAKFACVGIRMLKEVNKELKAGRTPVIDPFHIPKPGAVMGVPLGGIGAGTITRGFRGDFNRWQYKPGHYHHTAPMADQFSVFVKRGETAGQAKVLYSGPAPKPKDGLQSWNWSWNGDGGVYRAMYPRAWTVYNGAAGMDPELTMTCRQVTPVWGHNYKESSYPVAVFVWTIENAGPSTAQTSLMFTFQNGSAAEKEKKFMSRLGNVERQNTSVDEMIGGGSRLKGVEMKTTAGSKDRPYSNTHFVGALADDGVQVTTARLFSATDSSSEDLWNEFSKTGKTEFITSKASPEFPAGAVTAAVSVPPGESKEVVFVLSWDNPLNFFTEKDQYYRRYTRFFGRDGNQAVRIAADAVTNYEVWEEKIAAWQAPVIEDPGLHDWYKAALFNEMYFIADGGTVWTDGTQDSERPKEDDESIGKFAYLEGHEYPMMNTYDVHFYASFALAMNFPKLELSLQRDIAAATMTELDMKRKLLHSGKMGPRKSMYAVPHDIGTPTEAPWTLVNSYNFQDVSRWKDLNPKFCLQVYRDYVLTKDKDFLRDVFPAVKAAMIYVSQFDRDKDGLIENEGFPDQTFDAWTVVGPSAYSGGLWLAALQAAAEMAKICGDMPLHDEYKDTFKRGSKRYEELLWNGEYFNYDSSTQAHHDSIMADQMAGQWYARACGLDPIADPQKIATALQTVFRSNVERYHYGMRGAVNGMRPSGKVDTSSLQSREVWTGVTYGVAATMIQEGLIHEGFRTAMGCAYATYEELGYFFQTPEGWDNKGKFRSLAYMRPLSIWSIQLAWNNRPRDAETDIAVPSADKSGDYWHAGLPRVATQPKSTFRAVKHGSGRKSRKAAP